MTKCIIYSLFHLLHFIKHIALFLHIVECGLRCVDAERRSEYQIMNANRAKYENIHQGSLIRLLKNRDLFLGKCLLQAGKFISLFHVYALGYLCNLHIQHSVVNSTLVQSDLDSVSNVSSHQIKGIYLCLDHFGYEVYRDGV